MITVITHTGDRQSGKSEHLFKIFCEFSKENKNCYFVFLNTSILKIKKQIFLKNNPEMKCFINYKFITIYDALEGNQFFNSENCYLFFDEPSCADPFIRLTECSAEVKVNELYSKL